MEKIRGFEVVREDMRRTVGDIQLPTYSTVNSMACDIYSPSRIVIKPNEHKLIWTDIKAYMLDDEGLIINVRSSMGKQPVMLSNTQGWIDCDFFENESNDGNIGIMLLNLGETDYVIEKGDRIAQCTFIKVLKADVANSNITNKVRKGGFGSTGV